MTKSKTAKVSWKVSFFWCRKIIFYYVVALKYFIGISEKDVWKH